MEFLSSAEREAIRGQVRTMLNEAIAEASRSADPARAELGRALADGTLTPRDAVAGSAYQELLRARVDTAVRYGRATDEERQALVAADEPAEATEPERPHRPATTDDDYFDDLSILHRP